MGPLAFLAARLVVRYRNTPTVSISTRRDATAAVSSRTHLLVVRYQGEPSVDTRGPGFILWKPPCSLPHCSGGKNKVVLLRFHSKGECSGLGCASDPTGCVVKVALGSCFC